MHLVRIALPSLYEDEDDEIFHEIESVSAE